MISPNDVVDGEYATTVKVLTSLGPDVVPAALLEELTHAAYIRQWDYFFERAPLQIGGLVTVKLIADRRKDHVDVVELIKSRIAAGTWETDRHSVRDVVRHHLGLLGVRAVDRLVVEAQTELGL